MHSAFLALIDSESDKHKFEQIYEKYKNKVYNLAYKRLNDLQHAEDATQETFFRIAKILKIIMILIRLKLIGKFTQLQDMQRYTYTTNTIRL